MYIYHILETSEKLLNLSLQGFNTRNPDFTVLNRAEYLFYLNAFALLYVHSCQE